MNHGVADEPLPYDGSRYERWQIPVPHYGPGETDLDQQLAESDVLSSMATSKQEWDQTTKIVDNVLGLLIGQMKKEAAQTYGLVLHGYVRQGSAREGLTAGPLTELDAILKFSFKGLTFKMVDIRHNGKIVSEFDEVHVQESMSELKAMFPTLDRCHVFLQGIGTVLLSSRALHERVFTLLLDRAIQKILASEHRRQYNISIRLIISPTVNIRVEVIETQQVIDVDIVPGLVENTNEVQNSHHSENSESGLPLYGLFNWDLGERTRIPSFKHPDALWVLDTVSYELYLLDTSRHSDTRNYIIMALRILKAYFTKTKLRYQLEGKELSPLTGLLRSYHLKQIAFYCIQYLDIEKKRPLSGVREALGYIVDLLEVSLQEKHLPHFFSGNAGLRGVIPGFVPDEDHICFDHFGGMADDALNQAGLTLDKVLREDLDVFIEEGSLKESLVNKFRDYIHSKTCLQKPQPLAVE